MHPVSEGALMYRLHKRFSALELERAYSEIEELQVSPGPLPAVRRSVPCLGAQRGGGQVSGEAGGVGGG